MEQNRRALVLQLAIVALLAVIAFELAVQPHPATTSPASASVDTFGLQSELQSLDAHVQTLITQGTEANAYLKQEATSIAAMEAAIQSLEKEVNSANGYLKEICDNTGNALSGPVLPCR